MKKKVIIVVVSLLVFCMCVVFGYIVTSRKDVKNANEAKVDTSNQENTETANNEQVSKNEEKNNNNGEKIVGSDYKLKSTDHFYYGLYFL